MCDWRGDGTTLEIEPVTGFLVTGFLVTGLQLG